MYRSICRRLRYHDQCNMLSIIVILILLICIYLTIDSIEIYQKEENIFSINPLKRAVCPQLTSSSEEYFHVDIAQNSFIKNSLICKSSDILLVYILSTAKNVQRRETIRRTWARKKDNKQLNNICFVFIVGLSSNYSNIRYNSDIERESLISNDIVQLNVNESYQNVVYKEVGALKWSSIYASNIPFLFKTDDDLIIDSLLLSDIVQFFIQNNTNHSAYLEKDQYMRDFIQTMINVDKYTLFKGQDIGGMDTHRAGRFRIHELAWNHHLLPPYCSGFGVIFSSFIRDRLYLASLCYKKEYVPLVGDVFFSGFLGGAASVRCTGWSLMHLQRDNGCASFFEQHSRLLVCSAPLHIGKQIYSDFDTSWKVIQNRHTKQFKQKLNNQTHFIKKQ